MSETFTEKTNRIADVVVNRRSSPDEMAEAIEAVSKLLGFTIALAAQGDKSTIDTMMVGAENYAHQVAVEYQGLASLSGMAGGKS